LKFRSIAAAEERDGVTLTGFRGKETV